jgi:hypothetical protein
MNCEPAAFVGRHCSPQARTWLERTLADLRPPLDRAAFHAAHAGAARRIGDAMVAVDVESAGTPTEAPARRERPLHEIARAALLLRAIECLPWDEHPRFVDEVYRRGDGREQAALLRALELLPSAQRFLPTAIEACRTHDTSVFAAIACANTYPTRFFPDASFHQLVMKAIFLQLPLAAIVGLDRRVTPELQRMVRDYVAERRAAGRRIPDDLTTIVDAKGTT